MGHDLDGIVKVRDENFPKGIDDYMMNTKVRVFELVKILLFSCIN